MGQWEPGSRKVLCASKVFSPAHIEGTCICVSSSASKRILSLVLFILCSDLHFFCNCVLFVLMFSISVLALFPGSDDQFCLVHCSAEVRGALELWFQAVYNKGIKPAGQRTLWNYTRGNPFYSRAPWVLAAWASSESPWHLKFLERSFKSSLLVVGGHWDWKSEIPEY